MAGHRSKNGHRSGCDQCYKFYISFFILETAPPQLLLAAGFFLSAQKLQQLGDGGASTRPTARETKGRWLGTFATTGNKVQEGSAVQIASASVSLVRIRTTWSRPSTKILPSPIFPVFADEVIVSRTLST